MTQLRLWNLWSEIALCSTRTEKKDPDADTSRRAEKGSGLIQGRRERAFLIRCPSPFQTLWNLCRSPRSPRAREQLLRQINQWISWVNLPEPSAAGPTIISPGRCLALILLLPPFLPNILIRRIPSRYPAVTVRRRYLNLERVFVEEIPALKRISRVQPISFWRCRYFSLAKITIYLRVSEIYRCNVYGMHPPLKYNLS